MDSENVTDRYVGKEIEIKWKIQNTNENTAIWTPQHFDTNISIFVSGT